MRDTDSRPPLRELPARFSLPLIGDTLAFVRDPAGFLQKRARELGPVFRNWSVENQDLSPTKGKLFATPASGLQVE